MNAGAELTRAATRAGAAFDRFAEAMRAAGIPELEAQAEADVWAAMDLRDRGVALGRVVQTYGPDVVVDVLTEAGYDAHVIVGEVAP